MHKVELDSRTA